MTQTKAIEVVVAEAVVGVQVVVPMPGEGAAAVSGYGGRQHIQVQLNPKEAATLKLLLEGADRAGLRLNPPRASKPGETPAKGKRVEKPGEMIRWILQQVTVDPAQAGKS